ncbi:hypothetical protein FRC01_001686 [Tulasnella sp. 417]|nr:hypothetical protein FRC01_001686 [Tulasnella sp. 417]
MKIIITGASGVLGSAIYEEFKKHSGYEVLGLAHSNPGTELRKLDLLDVPATDALIKDFLPDWVIHCAAERRPDVAEKDPAAAEALNAQVPNTLGQLSATYGFTLFYISTDYVFDGTKPPYEVDDAPNPVNFYGKTKRQGEVAIQSIEGPGQRVIFRVPVLYGPAKKNSDTAINILLDVVQDQSGKTYKMDHYATRYPTNTLDIAAFFHRLAAKFPAESCSVPIPSIFHYSSAEPFTKYEICLIYAKILGVGHDHIIPDSEEPKGEAAVTRPKDCHLSTSVIEDTLKMDVGARGFEDYWRGVIGKGEVVADVVY